MSAPRLKEVVESHLALFHTNLQNVVCITTDGASVMEAFGRLLPCLHLKCQAHAINLSVCDVLYPKKAKKSSILKKSKKRARISESFLEEDSSESCSDIDEERDDHEEVMYIFEILAFQAFLSTPIIVQHLYNCLASPALLSISIALPP